MRQSRCVFCVALVLALFVLGSTRATVPPYGPASARAAECEGDECQGPAPAPEDPVPGTAVVEGPQNPPVHFPKPRHKRHHGKKHRAKKHPHHRRHQAHRGSRS